MSRRHPNRRRKRWNRDEHHEGPDSKIAPFLLSIDGGAPARYATLGEVAARIVHLEGGTVRGHEEALLVLLMFGDWVTRAGRHRYRVSQAVATGRQPSKVGR
jgi:hypothetical protein